MTSITSLYVMEGKEGVYLVLEDATHLEKQFGKDTLSGRFKRCP
jgi:hypothetical protein